MSECYCGVDHAAEDAAREARAEAAAEIARLRRRVSTLEGRLARVLRFARLYCVGRSRVVGGELRTPWCVWSSRRTGGKR